MSLALLILLTFSLPASGQRISLNLNGVTIQRAITEIQKLSGKSIIIESDGLDLNEKVNVLFTDKDVSTVIEDLFAQTGQDVSVFNKQKIIEVSKKIPSTQTPERSKDIVKGIISDENGAPVIGAVVTLKDNSAIHSITDIDGHYSINAPGNAVLFVSCLGYRSKDVSIGQRSVVDITLYEDKFALDEVVVTALGITHSQKSLGYATQKFDGDKLVKVKGANLGSSLTGQISGLRIYNSTEFDQEPKLRLRGETPLIVVDGIPTEQSLNDFNQDVIESITVLKGATASALYGSRGGNGAIMIVTKKSGEKGFKVEVNSSNLFFGGYLAIPKVQSSYSTGSGGKFGDLYYVWGEKLDVGNTAYRWDPVTKSMKDLPLTSCGKDNFKNFLEFSMVSNNSVSVSTKGENGSLHSSISYMYNKNPYPNTHMNKMWYNVGGELKLSDKMLVETSLNYNHSYAPQTAGYGYGTGYIYNILVWTGPDYDLRNYRDYWVIPNEKQNWFLTDWYDNPYFEAYEKLRSQELSTVNGSMSFKYNITDWMTLQLRGGGVYTGENVNIRSSVGTCSNNRNYWRDANKGYYREDKSSLIKMDYDALLLINKKFGAFSFDSVFGGSIYTYKYNSLSARTKNGLSVPGFYSIKASIDTPSVTPQTSSKQVNSLFGTITLGYKETFFIEATGRNDWSSTLPSDDNSYFYPSVSGSMIGSQIIKMPQWFPFWKVRGSWTISKRDLGIYDLNQTFSVTSDAWNGLNSASLPSSIRGSVKPITDRTWEVGASMYFLKDSRLKLDVAYYNKLTFNNTIQQVISSSTGFSKRLMNIDEEYVRKGFEATLDARIIEKKHFSWDSQINIGSSRRYYAKLDDEFSADKPWVQVGKRVDTYTFTGFQKDSYGNYIHGTNGKPIYSNYSSLYGYTDPDLEYGFINTFNIGRFTISANIDGRIGGVTWSTTDANMVNSGTHPMTDNQWRYDEVVNGLKNYIGPGVKVISGEATYDKYGQILTDTRQFAPNDIQTSYEGYWRSVYNQYDKLFVLDKTFLKLRELSVGYSFERDALKKAGISGMYIGLIGQNLLLLTTDFKFSDPDGFEGGDDESLASPSVRYFGANVKIEF